MKKYINSLFILFGLLAFTACTEEEGSTPGGDSQPSMSVVELTAAAPLNPDNDCVLRILTNNRVKEVYYLAETTATKEARGLSDDAYADYVVANGTKLTLDTDLQTGGQYSDLTIINLHGLYSVAVVAVNGNTKTMQIKAFAGLDYQPLGTGTYASNFFGDTWDVEVEYSEVGNRYRIADCWYDGYGFAFSPNGSNVTIYPSKVETGYVHRTYGMVSATDTGSTYDEATKTFTFAFKWTVAAGSFGVYKEYLTLP